MGPKKLPGGWRGNPGGEYGMDANRAPDMDVNKMHHSTEGNYVSNGLDISNCSLCRSATPHNLDSCQTMMDKQTQKHKMGKKIEGDYSPESPNFGGRGLEDL